ncbi:MAG: hypothetical protein NT163_09740 [Chlorobiales bacterium]|nr:hypothetical protein [Chlorobiales bacterium]
MKINDYNLFPPKSVTIKTENHNLQQRILELEKASLRSSRIEEELLQKQTAILEQNIKLIKKSIELSENKESSQQSYEVLIQRRSIHSRSKLRGIYP